MILIPPLILEEKHIGLKVLGSDEVCWIRWEEEWDWNKAHAHMYPELSIPISWGCYGESKNTNILDYYIVKCDISKKEYYLIASYGIEEADSLKSCICVNKNIFNVFSVWKEFGEIAKRNWER